MVLPEGPDGASDGNRRGPPEEPRIDAVMWIRSFIADWLRAAADLIEFGTLDDLPPPTGPPPPSGGGDPEVAGRRRALAGLILAPVVAAVAAFASRKGLEKRSLAHIEREQKLLGVPATKEWEPSELTENYVASFEAVLGGLKKDEVVFIDQHGNIIGGPIKVVPKGTIQPFDRDGTLSQEWLNAWRRELKEKYPTIHFDLKNNAEYPLLYQVVGALRGADSDTTYLDTVWQNAQMEVGKTGKTRLEYAREIFAKSTILPKDLQEIIINGICGVESAFSDDALSDAGALGSWQFMPDTAREHNLIRTEQKETVSRVKKTKRIKKRGLRPKSIWYWDTLKTASAETVDDRRNFEKATAGALSYFTQIYTELKADDAYQEIVRNFGLAEEDFLYPAVINAYHSGQNKMKKIFAWFLKQYPAERVQAEIGNGPYGLDIFTHMTMRYRIESDDPNYRKKSLDYFPKALAMRNLIHARLSDDRYRVDLTEEREYQPPAIPDDVFSHVARRYPMLANVGTAAFGAAAGAAVGAALMPPLRLAGRAMHRRRFLAAAGLAATGGAAGTAVAMIPPHRRIEEDVIDRDLLEDIASFDWSDGIKQSERVGRDLLAVNRLVDAKKVKSRVTLPSRTHVTRIMPWLNEAKPPKFRTQDDIDIARLVKLNEYGSPYYRCRSVGVTGTQIHDERRNNKDLIYVYPHMERLLKEIDERVNIELQQMGFPVDKYWARIIVTSAIRPEDYNVRVGGARTSSHIHGVALDISKTKFDIVDRKTNAFYGVPDSDARPNNGDSNVWGVNRKHRISVFCYTALARVLQAMDQENKIIVNREADHIHIVDKNYNKG